MSEKIAGLEQQEQVGDRLVALMNSRNLTAYQFAKSLGYEGPQKLYKLLRNESKPGYETLMDVLTHYPLLRAEWLMRGSGPRCEEGETEPVAREQAAPSKRRAGGRASCCWSRRHREARMSRCACWVG